MDENEHLAVDPTAPLLEEKPVKTSSAAWLGAANAMTGLLVAFAEGSAFQYLFVNKMGLDEKFNLVVWIIFGVWNAINDPLYGFLADHTHSKLGRRRPWIRYGAPAMAVLYALMWVTFPNTKGNNWLLFFQELVGIFLYDIVYTAIASAIYVMPYEMAVTNKNRNKIFLWNIGFSVISYGAPMVLNSQLDTLIEEHADIFPWIMAAMGLVCGAIVFISTFFYKENGYVQEEEQPKFWDGLKMCLKNKSFLLFEVVSWTVIFAQSALMGGLTYLTGMWANKDVTINGWIGDKSMLVLYGCIALGLILGLLLFIFQRDKWGTRTNILIALGTMALGTLLCSFLGVYFYVTCFAFFACGVGMAGGLYLIPMINGDVIDKDEIDNGHRREGVYAGINSLITKPAQSIAIALFPLMLATFFGFDKTLKMPVLNADGTQKIYGSGVAAVTTDWANQPATAKNGFFLCWMIITSVLLILSFIAMWFYPLHGKAWNEEKTKLAKLHKDKEFAYEQDILAKEEKEHPEDVIVAETTDKK